MPQRINSGTRIALRISMCWPLEFMSQPCTTQLEDWSFSSGHVPTANWVSLSCSEPYMDWRMLLWAFCSSETPLISLRLMVLRRGNSFSILESGLARWMVSRASSSFLMRWVRRAIARGEELESIARVFNDWERGVYIFGKKTGAVSEHELRRHVRFSTRTTAGAPLPRGRGARGCAAEARGGGRSRRCPRSRRRRRHLLGRR